MCYSDAAYRVVFVVHDHRWADIAPFFWCVCHYDLPFLRLTFAMIMIDYSLFYYFLLWFILLAIAVTFILVHGIDYVAWPKLNPPTDVIHYQGPGFRSAHHGKGIRGRSPGEELRRLSWEMGKKV